MKMRLAKLGVIAAAFFVLNGTRPDVTAQSNNCRCYGQASTWYHPLVYIGPACDDHLFDLWSTQSSFGACHSWCASTVEFLASGSCSTDVCHLDVGDLDPSHYDYGGQAVFLGPPAQSGPVARSWTHCPYP